MGGRQSRRRDTTPTITQNAAHVQTFNPLMSSRDAMRIAMEQSLQDAPLPPGWDQVSNLIQFHQNLKQLTLPITKAYTSKGVPYFIDHLNKTTTWIDPRSPEYVQQLFKFCIH